jgi:serine/threonine protein kinase
MVDDPTTVLRRPSQHGRELGAGATIGVWTIVRPLGGGGFGSVYEVRHRETGQTSALKILHAHFVASAEMLARFDREIEVLRRLEHRNIVRLVDAGFSDDGRPYLCMELLEGEELGHVIERMGSLPPVFALQVFAPLCDAVGAAHELGIIHRDIKASNVIVCRPVHGEELGRVVLLDFGIAKLSDALLPELTASHQSLGTPSCMAPEQIHGLRVDARTDIYALGGLLFHMLTGRMPFQDSSATMTQYLHLHARRPRASTIASVSQRLDDVIVRAMAIEPSARLPDPQSLLAAVRAAMRESTVHRAVGEIDCGAILVTVEDRNAGSVLDENLLDDLEAVLPIAERFLGNLSFTLAVDLGSSALFVTSAGTPQEHVEAALAVWEKLERRRSFDPRVRVGLCVQHGVASVVGNEVQAGPLLRPATWDIPDEIEGVWVTSAIDPAAPGGKRLR